MSSEQKRDVIEMDADTEDEEKSEKGGIYPYDPAYSDIEISDTPFSVFEYLRQLEKGKINIQPDFQRNQVWKNVQKSKFIESILLNFPLPPIYLNETKDSKFIVIDGLQRSTALKEFYNGELMLEGLEALPKYNDYYFKKNDKNAYCFENNAEVKELPETLQSKFEDKKLTVFTLKPSTPMVVIYDLFNRINTGGTQLNKQEVRNCIFIGKSTQLLKELAEEQYFKRAIDSGIKSTRMKDREVVLRYLAFRWFGYEEYNGDMSNYLESAMKNINQENDEYIDRMKIDFKRVMEISFSIWKYANFRIPTESTRGTINTAILETVCRYLALKNDTFIKKNMLVIEQNYKELISNKYYYDSVTRSTGNKQKVLDRFKLIEEILNRGTV